MIENPDGTKRVMTSQEMIDDIRTRSRAKSSNTGNDASIWRPAQGVNAEDRPVHERPPIVESGHGHNVEVDRNQNGSSSSTNDGNSGENRLAGTSDSRPNEHIDRPPADSTTRASDRVYTRPNLKSGFKQYTDAINNAFKKKPESGNVRGPGKKLSDAEAKANRDALIRILLIQSEHMDQAIIATTKQHLIIVIWSDIDQKDAAVLADWLIRRGKQDHRVAAVVRRLVDIELDIQAATIVLPRTYRTIEAYLIRGFSIR